MLNVDNASIYALLASCTRYPGRPCSAPMRSHVAYSTGLFSPADVARYRRSALGDAAELLVQNKVVIIFPEGYPNIDPNYTPKRNLDEFLPFKPDFLQILRAAEKKPIERYRS